MSANRIIKRRAFKASQPSSFAYWSAVRASERGEVRSRPAKRRSYHDYAIAAGDRHATYQKNIRLERLDQGLQPTSTDMCRVAGRRVA